jgi:hypothetical protein
MRGQAAIASLYDMLFRSVFRRSRVESELSGSRRLCEDAVLMHMRVEVHVPLGPMAGDHDCICSIVLQRRGEQWRIASLHNTLVSDGAVGVGSSPSSPLPLRPNLRRGSAPQSFISCISLVISPPQRLSG